MSVRPELEQVRTMESYISQWALPKEIIVSWIKWDPKFKPDKIILNYEADVRVIAFLNIDITVLEQDRRSGKNIISQEYLEIPGFFGFQAIYDAIPEEERKVDFVVEFYKDSNKIHIERLSTLITRPKIQAYVNPKDILIEGNIPFEGPIDIRLINRGSVDANAVTIYFKVHSIHELKPKLHFEKVADTGRENLTKAVALNAMTIRGKGNAYVEIAAVYTDNKNNEYRNPLATITLHVKQVIDNEIRINGLRPSNQFPILLAT